MSFFDSTHFALRHSQFPVSRLYCPFSSSPTSPILFLLLLRHSSSFPVCVFRFLALLFRSFRRARFLRGRAGPSGFGRLCVVGEHDGSDGSWSPQRAGGRVSD